MDQKYGKDPSNRCGTGLWNGCGPGPVAGPYNLTCTLFAVQELAHTQLLLVNCWESALCTGAQNGLKMVNHGKLPCVALSRTGSPNFRNRYGCLKHASRLANCSKYHLAFAIFPCLETWGPARMAACSQLSTQSADFKLLADLALPKSKSRVGCVQKWGTLFHHQIVLPVFWKDGGKRIIQKASHHQNEKVGRGQNPAKHWRCWSPLSNGP